MLIIGERINSTRPDIQKAIRARNSGLIAGEAKRQFDAGAGIIDINCAVLDNELDDIDWVVSVIQSELPSAGICIDSPSYLAIDRALSIYKGKGEVFINSITGEEGRISKIMPLAVKYETNLIALVMDENGMPRSNDERAGIAGKILSAVKKAGFPVERLYLDPLVRPISTEPGQAAEFLNSIKLLKALSGNCRIICGLSNISFGLPNRSLINSIFLSLAIYNGIDAALLDPLDKRVVGALRVSETILGRDEYCREYISAFRKGLV